MHIKLFYMKKQKNLQCLYILPVFLLTSHSRLTINMLLIPTLASSWCLLLQLFPYIPSNLFFRNTWMDFHKNQVKKVEDHFTQFFIHPDGEINKIEIRNILLFYLSYSTKQNLHKLNLLRLTTQRIDSSNFRISNVAGVFRYSGSLSP